MVISDAAAKMIQKIVSMRDLYFSMCEDSDLPEDMKERFRALIIERIEALA